MTEAYFWFTSPLPFAKTFAFAQLAFQLQGKLWIIRQKIIQEIVEALFFSILLSLREWGGHSAGLMTSSVSIREERHYSKSI